MKILVLGGNGSIGLNNSVGQAYAGQDAMVEFAQYLA